MGEYAEDDLCRADVYDDDCGDEDCVFDHDDDDE